MGHRNPQGLYFSEDLNSFFSTEHGPNGGDEINKIDNQQGKIKFKILDGHFILRQTLS